MRWRYGKLLPSVRKPHRLGTPTVQGKQIPENERSGRPDGVGAWGMPMIQREHRADRRQGFTILELLVAISVFAVLLALITPAVLRVRASARTVACRDHFRQVSLALQQYVSIHGQFPKTRGGNCSSLTATLPWLDQADLYQSTTDSSGSRPRVHPVGLAVFVCPEDHEAARLQGSTNIGENAGLCVKAAESRSGTQKYNGVFLSRREKQRITPGTMTDGLSNTAAYAEILRYTSGGQSRRVFRHASDRVICSGNAGELADRCRAATVSASLPSFANRGSDWRYGSLQINQYMHVLPPNEKDCLFVPGSASRHADGAHVALADGSVKFISSGIDEMIWQAAGTRSDSDGPVNW
jgi:prepilin-type N-terminal cleavage/methylation domain-containing protein/prepilin-type processing-associated H-X9-DG protein